jgi:hypothetical protein
LEDVLAVVHKFSDADDFEQDKDFRFYTTELPRAANAPPDGRAPSDSFPTYRRAPREPLYFGHVSKGEKVGGRGPPRGNRALRFYAPRSIVGSRQTAVGS